MIQGKIHEARDQRGMPDGDSAGIHGVETRVLHQAVKRDIERFPGDFIFQLTGEEVHDWKSRIVLSRPGNGGEERG